MNAGFDKPSTVPLDTDTEQQINDAMMGMPSREIFKAMARAIERLQVRAEYPQSGLKNSFLLEELHKISGL